MTTTADLQNMIVSPSEVAALVGHPPSWVHRELIDSGRVSRVGRGQLSLGEVVKAIAGYYQALAEKARHRPRRLDELKALERMNVLVEVDKVVEWINTANVALRQELEGIPVVATRDLDTRRKIEEAICEAFRRYTAKMDEQFRRETGEPA